VNYTYDGMGALVNRDSSVSGSVYYLNNGTQTLLDSTTSDFAAITKYTNGTGGLLGKINPALAAEYYYYDALGSLGALADQTGAVTGSYRYDPWGSVIQQNGTATNRNFVGKFGVTEEVEGGLTHMGDRFYDPSTGVFLQKDPVMGSNDNPMSMVPYIYALNDPLNRIDPSGRWSVKSDLSKVNGDYWTKTSVHEVITDNAMTLFDNTTKATVGKGFREKLLFERQQMLNGTNAGDDDPSYAMADHFWDSSRQGVNYMGKNSNTAVNRVEEYFNLAKEQYKLAQADCRINYVTRANFRFSKAFFYLGKSAHFLQDLVNPYHSSNMVSNSSLSRGYNKKIKNEPSKGNFNYADHEEYEEWATGEVNGIKSSYIANELDYSAVKENSVKTFGMEVGIRYSSKSRTDLWRTAYVQYSTGLYETYYFTHNTGVLQGLIRQSERDTAKLIYRFYLDLIKKH
jgi:RHS repeat-associated protein